MNCKFVISSSMLTTQVLVAALTLGSAMVSSARAQTSSTPYSDKIYPQSEVPASLHQPYLNKQLMSPSTAFLCSRVGTVPALRVQVNGQTLETPLIIFQTESQNSPAQRCQNVAQRLTKAVSQNGGSLRGLLLATGIVNNQTVICFIKTTESCTSSNVILTLLKPENAQNAGRVLAQLVRFGHQESGSTIHESGSLDEEGRNLQLEPRAISLEDAVHQIAVASNNLESGGTNFNTDTPDTPDSNASSSRSYVPAPASSSNE